MTILVQNNTDENRYIYRFSGIKLQIPPKDFITFECTNTDESDFWKAQSNKILTGIKVIVDPNKIRYFNKLKINNKYDTLIVNKQTTEIITDTDTDIVEEVPVVETPLEIPTEEPVITTSFVETTLTSDNNITSDIEPVAIEEVEEPVIYTEEKVSEELEVVDTDESNSITYTSDYLSTLTKNELFEILDSMNVSYKRNNSVSTLVSLILDNYNSED